MPLFPVESKTLPAAPCVIRHAAIGLLALFALTGCSPRAMPPHVIPPNTAAASVAPGAQSSPSRP